MRYLYNINSFLNMYIRYIIALFLVVASLSLKAQDPNERGNLNNYYNEKLHFGFTLGINRSNFIVRYAENFERFDSLKTIESVPKWGFNLGIVSELRLHKYVTLRFVPNLSFAERNLQYYYEGWYDTQSVEGQTGYTKVQGIESTFLNFPLDLKCVFLF